MNYFHVTLAEFKRAKAGYPWPAWVLRSTGRQFDIGSYLVQEKGKAIEILSPAEFRERYDK